MAGCFWEAFGARACLWVCPQSFGFQCFTFNKANWSEITCVSKFKYLKVLFEMFYSFKGREGFIGSKTSELLRANIPGRQTTAPRTQTFRAPPNLMTDAPLSLTLDASL